jgi:hypothetical protein
MMSDIVLNRDQIHKLGEIVSHFKEINKFRIKTDSISGIGACISVSFTLFDDKENDTSIDITDISDW